MKEETLKDNGRAKDIDLDLAELLQSNLKDSEKILREINDIKKYIRWQQIWSTVRILIIVIPLALGFIYLPPVIKDLFSAINGSNACLQSVR